MERLNDWLDSSKRALSKDYLYRFAVQLRADLASANEKLGLTEIALDRKRIWLASCEIALDDARTERNALTAQVEAMRAHVEKRIAEIDADPRRHYPSAKVQVNAPLALVQYTMGGAMMELDSMRKIVSAAPTATPTNRIGDAPQYNDLLNAAQYYRCEYRGEVADLAMRRFGINATNQQMFDLKQAADLTIDAALAALNRDEGGAT